MGFKFFNLFLIGLSISNVKAQLPPSELFLTCDRERIDAYLSSGPGVAEVQSALISLNLKVETLHTQYVAELLAPPDPCKLRRAREFLAIEQAKVDLEMRSQYAYLTDEQYQEIAVDLYLQAGVQQRLPDDVYQVIRDDQEVHRCLRVSRQVQDWLRLQQK